MASTPHTSSRQLFEVLVRENADMLFAYLRSLVRDPGVLDDLFQDTIVTAWRRLDDFDRTRPFGPWLRGIACRTAMARHRSTGRLMFCEDAEVLREIDRRFDSVQNIEGESFRERAGSVRECLEKLPDLMRQCIELAYVRDMLLGEIAAALAATEEAIKKRVQRGRALLGECLERKSVRAL